MSNWNFVLLSLTGRNVILTFYWNNLISNIQILHEIFFCLYLHIDLSLLEFSSVVDLNLYHWFTILSILFFCDTYSLPNTINLLLPHIPIIILALFSTFITIPSTSNWIWGGLQRKGGTKRRKIINIQEKIEVKL